MFGQDCDSVREFCSLNVVYHLFRKPKKGRKLIVVVNGVLDPSTPQSGGQIPYYGANKLDSNLPVADNNGLFWGFRVTSPS